jgi:nucleoside permease NupC
MQWVVIKLGWLIQVSMGTTVCESVNAAASVFLGMVSNCAVTSSVNIAVQDMYAWSWLKRIF